MSSSLTEFQHCLLKFAHNDTDNSNLKMIVSHSESYHIQLNAKNLHQACKKQLVVELNQIRITPKTF